jgi:hypothetical protein
MKKKDCAYTRKSLRKYLRGHLFKYEQVKIARHLNSCPVCRSEFLALKKVADTKQLLKDITPPENLAQRISAGVSGLAKLRLLLYRPLWMAAIIGIGTLLYINVIAPNQRDLEIENIEKSLPPAAPFVSAPVPTSGMTLALGVPDTEAPLKTVSKSAETQPLQPSTPQPAAAASLLVTVTPQDDNEAVQSINAIMRGHPQLGGLTFSDTVREVSARLTPQELLIFFNRIMPVARVSYSRKLFSSLPQTEPVPFVMKLKPAPREQKPAAAPAAALPVSAPTQSVQ